MEKSDDSERKGKFHFVKKGMPGAVVVDTTRCRAWRGQGSISCLAGRRHPGAAGDLAEKGLEGIWADRQES